MPFISFFKKASDKRPEIFPKPFSPKPRHKCPFYGFSLFGSTMMDQQGNRCALIIESHTPCQMEFKGEMPNWEKCPYNIGDRETMEKIKNSFRIYPYEFRFFGNKGISFQEWSDYVMRDEFERPQIKKGE